MMKLKQPRKISVGLLLSLSIITAGCDKKVISEGSLTQGCSPSITSTGQETKIPHPTKPNECKFGAVFYCNVCVYDEQGGLTHSESDACGVCVGGTF